MRIPCPICGLRDSGEFTYAGDATVQYPALDADQDAWYEAVYERRNPRGPHTEYWHHTAGCRRYIIVERDTLTHEVFGARLPHGPDPSQSPETGGKARAGTAAKATRKTAGKTTGKTAGKTAGGAKPGPRRRTTTPRGGARGGA